MSLHGVVSHGEYDAAIDEPAFEHLTDIASSAIPPSARRARRTRPRSGRAVRGASGGRSLRRRAGAGHAATVRTFRRRPRAQRRSRGHRRRSGEPSLPAGGNGDGTVIRATNAGALSARRDGRTPVAEDARTASEGDEP